MDDDLTTPACSPELLEELRTVHRGAAHGDVDDDAWQALWRIFRMVGLTDS